MSEAVNGEPKYEEPLGGTELHEHQIELQQLDGIYCAVASVAEPTFSDGRRRNSTESHESQYMQIQQTESIYDTLKVAEQIQQNAFDGTLINSESKMKLKQLEDVNDTVRVSKREVSCRYLVCLLVLL